MDVAGESRGIGGLDGIDVYSDRVCARNCIYFYSPTNSRLGVRFSSVVLPSNEEMPRMSNYAQTPLGLARADSANERDKYGNVPRLRAIQTAWSGRRLGKITDLGGHAGFFSLTLVGDGLAEESTIYDVSEDALIKGRQFAKEMRLSERARFVQQSVDIEFLKQMQPTETIICLNLLHHAGDKFDSDLVSKQGWARYALDWLATMRSKARQAAFGVGFENTKPKYWDTPVATRPAALASIIRSAGWSITYDANVGDLETLGFQVANGRFTTGGAQLIAEPSRSLSDRIRKKVARLTGLNVRPVPINFEKKSRYHLYILE